MKQLTPFGFMALFAGVLLAADAKEEVAKSAKQLGEKPNYTWKTTIVVPDDAPFRPGPTDGKTEKGGFTHLRTSFFDNPIEVVLKGEKAAVTTEGGWQSLTEVENLEGPARFLGFIVRNAKLPAMEAAELASYAKDLKKEADVYSSDLTEEGAKAMQAFKTSSGSATVNGATGSVKFWLKDGSLTKYEFKLKGTIKFNDNDIPNARTTTVELKDVGTTKVEVPDAAKKKF